MDNKKPEWLSLFDERQRKEIELAAIYARDFHHGTTGHNQLMIIAQMAFLLDTLEAKGVNILATSEWPHATEK